MKIDGTVDLAMVGVLSQAELERNVFQFGELGALRPGERVVRTTAGDQVWGLVYGHVAAEVAVRAAATLLGDVDPDEDPTVLDRHTAHPPEWALFTRHLLDCAKGGDPTKCGCDPDGDGIGDGFFAFEADEHIPGSVPITPVALPTTGADRLSDALDGRR